MCTEVTCMDGTRRVDRMVYRYPNIQGGSLWHEEFFITIWDEVDAMVKFLNGNNLSKEGMFVYTEAVEGSGGHSGGGKHLVSMVEVDYMKIILTMLTMIPIPSMSTKKEVKVINNPFHHMRKKSNGTMTANKKATSTNKSTISIQAAVVFTTTITELMNVTFMIWIKWKMSCQHRLATLPMKMKNKAMSVQTDLILLKVLIIQAQSQSQMMMMRCLMTVYLSRTIITVEMSIGMSMPTWSRQRWQYGVHSLGL
ncbi:unnamed protein product [Linum trigynum]|uniref:Uncharacterized protein n=1 Tax=Linum trigynum TaxID=586398 RepID=A0AAV2G526_9ROSI